MDNCKYKEGSGCSGICCEGCGRMDSPLNTFDWLAGVPGNYEDTDIVEVQFKNTRKGYYKNSNAIPLKKGDVVAVEATPGHDIGTVTLTGRLVLLQLKKTRLTPDSEFKRIYRKAKPVDMEKFAEAKAITTGRTYNNNARQTATGGSDFWESGVVNPDRILYDLAIILHPELKLSADGEKALYYYKPLR